MYSHAKIVPITGTAITSTFALFYLMQALVATDKLQLEDDAHYIPPLIIFAEPPVEKARQIMTVDKPVPIDDPEPVPNNPKTTIDGDDAWGVPPIAPPAKPTPETGFNPLATVDGNAIPIVRVLATYPRRALEAGTEGSVVLEFTVNDDGTVGDATVIEAEPQNIFDRAALAAIAKYKFKPKVIDGKARATKGMRYRMVFSLSD